MSDCHGLLECTWRISPPGLIVEGIKGTATDATKSLASDGIHALAQSLADGLVKVLTFVLSFWVNQDSQVGAGKATMQDIQTWVLPIVIMIAVCGVIWHGIRMILTRKANPLINIGQGLGLMVIWAFVGITGPIMASKAADAFSTWVIDQSTDGNFSDRILKLFAIDGAQNSGLVIVLAIVGIVASSIQAVLMIFRDAAVVILCGLIVLAASGRMFAATSNWLRKITGWMMALICYKPAAALVYAAAFAFIGNTKEDAIIAAVTFNALAIRQYLTGMAMLVLSVLALPALMRLFTWTIGALESGGGSIPAAAGIAGNAGADIAAKRVASGQGAQDHARFVQHSLGPAGGGGTSRGGAAAGSGPAGPLPSSGLSSAAATNSDGPQTSTSVPNSRPDHGGSASTGSEVPKPITAPTGAANTQTATASAAPAASGAGAAGGANAAAGAAPPVAVLQAGVQLASKGADGATTAIGEPPK